MTTATPFEIAIPPATLERIAARVRDYPWDSVRSTGKGDAQLGVPRELAHGVIEHWRDRFDWRVQETAINQTPHYTATIDGQTIRFAHRRAGGDALPILLIHGWPYSSVSYLDVARELAEPSAPGLAGHDVFVPSLPGFGFSGAPEQPMGPAAMGSLLDRLMTEVLGYDRYLPHGGDFGGFVASRIGFDQPGHVAGVSSASFMVRHAGAALGSGQTGADDASQAERDFVSAEASGFLQEGGYAAIQGTRPVLLDFAMADSPVGAALWIVEKFARWSDRRGGAVEEIFTFEQLLTEAMVAIATGSFGTSTWIYPGYVQEKSATLPKGRLVEAPTAFAAFPDPVFPPPPRSFMERSHHVVRWTEMPSGGHFPFYEAPDDLVAELRAVAAMLA